MYLSEINTSDKIFFTYQDRVKDHVLYIKITHITMYVMYLVYTPTRIGNWTTKIKY